MAQGADPVATPGQDLVGIGLVAHVPDQPVPGGVKNIVEGNRQLDHTQAGPEVAPGHRDSVNGLPAEFVGELAQVGSG